VKTLPLALLVTLAGLGIGAGASFGTSYAMGAMTEHAATAAADEPPTFVSSGTILAPLVYPSGRLAGYVVFDAELQTSAENAEIVRARLPLLMHAVNMRTYRTPMASGPDGMLPNLEVFRALLVAASTEAFGKGVVERVAITRAAPG
jgi:hypothetical protein